MIKITFPDGSVREYNEGVTGLQIAESISSRLAQDVLACGVNGEVYDLGRPISEDAEVVLYKWEDEQGKHAFWHTSAHLLAEALQDGGQPVDGHAGKGGHLHKTGVQPLQAGGGLHQRVVVGAQPFDLGQQRPAIRRQHHAAPVAAEKRHPQLVLQRLDGVADAGLGEVQFLCRPGEAAALHGLEEHLVFGYAHGGTSCTVAVAIISYFFSYLQIQLCVLQLKTFVVI